MLYRRVRWCCTAGLLYAIPQDDAMLYRRVTLPRSKNQLVCARLDSLQEQS
jgi:hypothetical protein